MLSQIPKSLFVSLSALSLLFSDVALSAITTDVYLVPGRHSQTPGTADASGHSHINFDVDTTCSPNPATYRNSPILSTWNTIVPDVTGTVTLISLSQPTKPTQLTISSQPPASRQPGSSMTLPSLLVSSVTGVTSTAGSYAFASGSQITTSLSADVTTTPGSLSGVASTRPAAVFTSHAGESTILATTRLNSTQGASGNNSITDSRTIDSPTSSAKPQSNSSCSGSTNLSSPTRSISNSVHTSALSFSIPLGSATSHSMSLGSAGVTTTAFGSDSSMHTISGSVVKSCSTRVFNFYTESETNAPSQNYLPHASKRFR